LPAKSLYPNIGDFKIGKTLDSSTQARLAERKFIKFALDFDLTINESGAFYSD
jgi:hypothetical protein